MKYLPTYVLHPQPLKQVPNLLVRVVFELNEVGTFSFPHFYYEKKLFQKPDFSDENINLNLGECLVFISKLCNVLNKHFIYVH